MVKEPHHFTRADFIRAFLGAFVVSITFLFKGSMVNFAIKMTMANTISVVALTCLLLTMEIYVLSYRFVYDRKKRPFIEFWAKRFFSVIIASFISIYILAFAYGINTIVTSGLELFKVCIAILLPSATVGGAMEILKKRE